MKTRIKIVGEEGGQGKEGGNKRQTFKDLVRLPHKFYENEMEYQFRSLHEINLKTFESEEGKCLVLSVAMNKRVLHFTFNSFSYEYL